MGAEGIEPTASSLSEKRSTSELRALISIFKYFYINFNIKYQQKQEGYKRPLVFVGFY